jgi:Rieske Fe-S protein
MQSCHALGCYGLIYGNMLRSCPLKAPLSRPAGIPDSFLNRREWVKTFVIGSAAALGGGGFKHSLLSEISPGADPANIIKINTALYPTLSDEYGSMRFDLFGSTVPNGIITVTRAPGDVFHAVSAYCTHAGCIVEPFEAAYGKMICYCHSSEYTIQGQVLYAATEGQANLPYYNSSLDGYMLRVEIPGLNFKVNSIARANAVGGNARFLISFPPKTGGRYRILHTPDLSTTPTQVNFSNTAGGSLNQTQFNATSNTTKNVWVQNNGERGFYMVEMIVTPYGV